MTSTLLRQNFCPYNITGLGFLNAAAQQDDNLTTALYEIEPVSWTISQPRLTYTLTDRLRIT
jgi:hypothetical protein